MSATREAVVGPSRSRLGYHLLLARSMTSTNVRARMEYRLDFLVWLTLGLIFQIAALAFVFVVIGRFGGIEGWSVQDILLIAAIRLISHSVFETLFGNIARTTRLIRDGWMDRILVRPANALVQVVLFSFQANGIGDLVIGVLALIAAQRGLHLHWTPASVGFFALVVIGSILLEAGMQLAVAASSFWFIRTDNLSWWVDELGNSFANYPLTIFPIGAQAIFTFVVPIAFLGFYPATVFLGRTDEAPFTPLLAYGAPVVGALVFAGAYVLWTIGIRHHRSTGT